VPGLTCPLVRWRVMGWEYRRATWDEVCELGPQGWRLVATPPFAEVRQGLAGPQMMGELLYTVEREVAGRVEPGPGTPLVKLR